MKLSSLLGRGQQSRRAEGYKIFVIGSGRSGTHWLGYILEGHSDIHVTVEAPPIFNWATEMALDPRKKEKLMPKLIREYNIEHKAVSPKHYADKSHPNIWHAEDLAAAFPEARFVGIQRNPYATVASMLKHKGVLAWHERWKEFPVPNRFLGITQENRDSYEAMPLAAKCALRWKVHKERMESLGDILGDRLLVVKYEDVILKPEEQLAKLNAFLCLPTPIPMPDIKAESLDRWKTEFSPEIQRQVSEVSGISPDAC